MMKIWRNSFNIYLLALACGLAGCQNFSLAKRKDISTLRLHYVINPDGTERCLPITVYRSSPMTFYIDRSPFLHEGYVKRAAVVTNLNSYGIEIEFDHQGALVLDSVSTSYKSRHIAIFSDFSPAQKRWLAAPLVNNRITNGVLNFTPDASREEAERIVRGLNNVAGKWQKRK